MLQIRNVFLSLFALGIFYSHPAGAQTIYVSEVLASNDDSLLDEDGDDSDWIELYNASEGSVDLDGWYLTDRSTDLVQWRFPATHIAAKGFLIIFASDKDRSVAGEELHTNFKLSANDDQVLLVRPDGVSIESQVSFSNQEDNISYGYKFSSSGFEPITVLEAGAPCTAHIPNSASAADWQDAGFNDSGWLSGETGVGYDEETTYGHLIGLDVSAMSESTASVYIRVPFTVDHVGSISSLTLKMKYDDAFVAYLNGSQIAASANAPTTLAWDSGATTTHDDSAAQLFEAFDVSAYADALQEGSNILAIHGMNRGRTSSDLIIMPKIEASFADGDIDPSSIGLLTRPTPGAANSSISYAGSVETPVTFPRRGFYDAPVTVVVSNVTQGAILRYTTDGSTPAESSTEYTTPITIDETTCFRVGAFMDGWKPSYPRTDTYLFVEDIVLQPESDTSINGQAMAYGMNQDVVNRTYTDASNQVVSVQDALKSIPTLSISTDDANLYDPSIGIYVNAAQRWERPVSAELIYPNGEEGFHINAGLRIRGGYSRHSNYEKHNFRLFFRDEYGEGKLEYALFEDEGVDEFKKVDLRSAINYNWAKEQNSKNTFLRDIFTRDAAGAMGNAYTRSRYYHLYLNGQYWGIYMTEERPVADFAESYMGGDSDDYDCIKTTSWLDDPSYVVEATDGTTNAYYRLYSAAMAGFANNEDYFAVQGLDINGEMDASQEKLLDVENLVDYLLLIYYTGASDNCITKFLSGGDAVLNNLYALYNRVNPDGFKWIQHDCEHALDTSTSLDRTGPFAHSNFTLPQYFNAMTLHDKLSVNEEYRLKFADQVYKHFYNDGALVRTNCESRLDYRAAQIDRAIVANAARWGSTSLDRDTWVSAVATTRAFFSRSGDRCAEVVGYLDADGLIPSVTPPRFNLNGGLVPAGTTITLTMQEDAPPVLSSPYYGTPHAVPGTIELEDYDLGGPGVAYFDSDIINNGGEYRISENVDIEESGEGGYSIGWTDTGEWMKYTVDVASSGDYEITIRVASPSDSSACHIEVNDVDVTGSILFPDTGGWKNWTDLSVSVGLASGEQVVKLVIDGKACNLNTMRFTDLHTADLPIASGPSAPPAEKVIYYTTDGSDPRAIGGAIAGSSYGGAISITRPTHLKARCRAENGEWSALADATFWTPEIPLAVTELMYHAPDGNAHDFIEVQNVSDETMTLKGYKLDNAVDFKFKNAAQDTLAPGEYLVVVDDIDAFNASYPSNTIRVAGEFSGDLSGGGEKVDLEFRDNDLVSFIYDDARNWPQAADGAGHSLIPLDLDNQEAGSLDYGGNWRASTYVGGSPGYADPEPRATVVLNEISAHTDTELEPPYDSNDKIELHNTSASTVTISGWTLSDSLDETDKWLIPDTTIPGNGFVMFDETDFHVDATNGFGLDKAGELVVLSAPGRVVDAVRFKGQENEDTGVSWGRYPDGDGDWITTAPTLGRENEPVGATVRISELMYNPLQPGNDYEYIQIENVGSSSHAFENQTGTYRIDGGVEFDFPSGTRLSAGEKLWILSFNPTNTVKLHLFCAAYGLSAANETFLGGYSGSLSDRGERVAIERPQDSDDPSKPLDISWVVVDELFYFDQGPWPGEADGTGSPLVRTGLSSWGTSSVNDSDADQIPDDWELNYFQSLEQVDSDPDLDGFSNLDEYIADTNPTDSQSYFAIEAQQASAIYWTPVAGRTYSVFWTDDLSRPFVQIASGLTEGVFVDEERSGPSFYKIMVKM